MVSSRCLGCLSQGDLFANLADLHHLPERALDEDKPAKAVINAALIDHAAGHDLGRGASCRGDPVLRGVLAHVRRSFLGTTEGSVIAGGRSKKGAEWLPLRPFGGDGELYAVAQHGNGERKLVFSSSRVLTTAVN